MNEYKFDMEEVKDELLKSTGGDIYIDWTYSDKAIAIIRINNVQTRNSITGKMMVDLMDCVKTLEQWKEGKAVIVCGNGVNFSSGGNLDFALQCSQPSKASNMSCWMMATLRRLCDLKLVTVCVAHGQVVGGGAEISIFCDYLLVTDNVELSFVHGFLGIITAWGGGTRLIQKLGESKALKLLLTSKKLRAEECLSMGLAEAVISTDNFLEEAINWLGEYIKHSPLVINAYKCLVSASREGDSNKTFERERYLTSILWGEEGHVEQLKKHKEKISNRNKKQLDEKQEEET